MIKSNLRIDRNILMAIQESSIRGTRFDKSDRSDKSNFN